MSRAKEFWTSGKKGSLSPWSQAKVWALTKVSEEYDLGLTLNDIGQKVWKIGRPRKHPSYEAIRQLQAAFADDDDWYPGKSLEVAAARGPKVKFTAQKRGAVKRSLEAAKREGVEPSVPLARRRCPTATVNPDTGKPFDKKLILDVMRTECKDEGAREPWGHLVPVSKTALSPEMKQLRWDWSRTEGDTIKTPQWYAKHCVWFDPNYTILTTDERATFDQHQATFGKNKPRWISPDARFQSRNMRASPYANKQARRGDRKVWWHLVLTRGRVHYEVMGAGWKQDGAGQAAFVDRLEAYLTKRFGSEPKPRVAYTDRGPGFYAPIGAIVPAYAAALRKHGFRPYAGEDGRHQPADMPDVLLHERAAAWTKDWMAKHPVRKLDSLDTMESELRQRLRECEAHINAKHKVANLCFSYPDRVTALRQARGERLRG